MNLGRLLGSAYSVSTVESRLRREWGATLKAVEANLIAHALNTAEDAIYVAECARLEYVENPSTEKEMIKNAMTFRAYNAVRLARILMRPK